MSIEVRTQAKLDRALADHPDELIVLVGDGTFTFRGSSSPRVVAWGSSSPRVVARESSSPHVEAWESSSPHVVARESSSPHVVARESSSPHVEAWESSSPRVEAWESSSPRVVAWGASSPRVVAWGSSSPHVVAWGSSSPHVVARGSSSPRVVAWGSSSPHVVAWGSSSPHVVAWESSSPHGSVGKWAHMTVLSHGPTVDIPGAHILAVPEITTAADWCDYHGATVRDDGTVVLFKAVDDAWRSGRGMIYAPGTTPAAPDWDPVPECGGGLHFCASPSAALSFNLAATRFVACPVALDEIVVHPNAAYPSKVKAPRVVAPCWAVDITGEPLDQEVTP